MELMDLYLIIGIYIILILVFYIVLHIFSKHLSKMLSYAFYRFDEIVYIYSLEVAKNKENIYNYQKTIDVLFDSYKKFIKDGNYKLKDIRGILKDLKEDILYFSDNIVKKNITEIQNIKDIKDDFDMLERFLNIYNVLRYLFIVVTLGVGYMFIKKIY